MVNDYIAWFKDISQTDIETVGGKNASLGEMIRHLTSLGVEVPQGFAVTAKAYRSFLKENNLDQKIEDVLTGLNIEDVKQLADVGHKIRTLILASNFPPPIEQSIRTAYEKFSDANHNSHDKASHSVAVRSSATAEDLPEASFAGQQETYLNVTGIEDVLLAVKRVFASLYNDRAIAYRVHHNFPHALVAISAGIQQMVRSDVGASGVMFTNDTESGFNDVILINASYGLGELLVQGAVNPDEFYVYKLAVSQGKSAVIRKHLGSKLQKMIYSNSALLSESHKRHENNTNTAVQIVSVPDTDQKRFSLTDDELQYLAKQAMLIEQHYGCTMDIEWAKDGISGKLYILQARPETVSHRTKNTLSLERYQLSSRGKILAEGRSVGQKIGAGIARVLKSHADMHELQPGEVLVTDMTDPDWEPVMKRASAIATNRGGRTCHAAIVARELGIPAVVGCGSATQAIVTGQSVTVSCAEGDTGYIYDQKLDFEIKRLDLETLPPLPFKIMMTVGNPERAFDFQKLPNAGVGLARLEFIIAQGIGIHPRACLEFSTLSSVIQKKIKDKTAGYDSPESFYVNKLAEGIATLGAAFYPKPVTVRLSDFKSNEYANLLGGSEFEPKEENPMLGFRGASRYVSKEFRACFALECQAVRKVREQQGLMNIEVMIPFVRTPDEAKAVIELLEEQGLKRGKEGLRIIMMCEIPANALLAEQFLQYFDGFSIGSNDLTQLTLGLDRDSGLVAHLFDERNPAVTGLIESAINACKAANKTISICGQGPSDYPDFARWLMEKGIDSVSLNPDSVLSTWLELG